MRKQLHVQQFLRHKSIELGGGILALEALKEHYAIKFNISPCGNLVTLKYDQIESQKAHKYVRECRGLVLELRANSFDVVCQQFHRFFNFGEEPEVTNEHIPNMKIVEKHDGSLMSLYNYAGAWYTCTSGTPTAYTNVGDWELSFSDLFWKAFHPRTLDHLSIDCTYTFELVSPMNKIVRDYTEPEIILIGGRDENLREFNDVELATIAQVMGFSAPVVYGLGDIDSILDSWKDLKPQEEGYVAVDYGSQDEYGNFLRCKIKNPAYVALHRLKDSSCNSKRALLQVVLTGEVDEIVSYFQEYACVLREFQVKVDKLIEDHDIFAQQAIKEGWPPQQIGPRAGQAGLTAGWIFTIVNGHAKNTQEVIRKGIKDKGIKCFAKNLMKKW